MKKTLMMLMVFGALAASADSYLYWMVDQSATSTYKYDTVKIAASKDGGATSDFLTLYYGDGTAVGGNSVSAGTTKDYAEAGLGLYAALGADAATYSYAIELFNDSTFVANSVDGYTWYSYSALQDYIVASNMSAPSSNAWSPSTYAIPEPNSALLMVIGCAMLGLRRRKLRV